jgi:chitinase
LSFTDAAVVPGATYSYAVAAVDAAGNVGAATTATVTTTASDTIAPTPVANLRASVAKNRAVKLTWSAATDNVAVTAYLVSRNSATVATVSTLSFTQQRVGVGSYTYTVQARDAAGNLSDPATVTVTVK